MFAVIYQQALAVVIMTIGALTISSDPATASAWLLLAIFNLLFPMSFKVGEHK